MQKLTVGWREWLALPEIGVPAIKAKIDTGARTSALHTFALETFEADGRLQVRFSLHPLQNRQDVEVISVADVIDKRVVKSSSGQTEERYVVKTQVQLGVWAWPIEITLTNREEMKFRMLLGREAMQSRILVDPSASYLWGRSRRKRYPHKPL